MKKFTQYMMSFGITKYRENGLGSFQETWPMTRIIDTKIFTLGWMVIEEFIPSWWPASFRQEGVSKFFHQPNFVGQIIILVVNSIRTLKIFESDS